MTRERLEGIAAVNAAPAGTTLLGPLFEDSPRFLERLLAARPFESWDALWARAREIAHAMPEVEQIELVNAHPRLGAPRDRVSALSAREQGYDRPAGEGAIAGPAGEAAIGGPSPATAGRLAELNGAYEARFGFRYCVFVAGRPLEALLPDFEAALAADRDSELHRGLDAVVDIARARNGAITTAGLDRGGA